MSRNYKGYTVTFKTLSPLLLSPRTSCAFYRDALLDDDDAEFFKIGDSDEYYNIIYPSYRYGEYEFFDPAKMHSSPEEALSNPKKTLYYIPGSSIKGALTAGTDCKRAPISFMVDDAAEQFLKKDFRVISPLKSQYFGTLPKKDCWKEIEGRAKSTKKSPTDKIPIPKLGPFFSGTVGVEVLCADVTFSTVIHCTEDIDSIINNALSATNEKLERYLQQLKDFVERIVELKNRCSENDKKPCQTTIESLDRIIEFTESQLVDNPKKSLLFLGGYKGLLRSCGSKAIPNQSAIFTDDEYRPFGYIDVISWK